jgi:hypothetical protein
MSDRATDCRGCFSCLSRDRGDVVRGLRCLSLGRVILALLVCLGTAGLVVRTPRPISTTPTYKAIVKPRRNKESIIVPALAEARQNGSQTSRKRIARSPVRARIDLPHAERTLPCGPLTIGAAPGPIHLRC